MFTDWQPEAKDYSDQEKVKKEHLYSQTYRSHPFQTASWPGLLEENIHASVFVSTLYLPDRLHATACMAVSCMNSFPALSLPDPLYLAITEQLNTDSSSLE